MRSTTRGAGRRGEARSVGAPRSDRTSIDVSVAWKGQSDGTAHRFTCGGVRRRVGHVIGLCMQVARRSPVPPLRRSAPCVCRAAVLRSPPVPLAATRNGPLCVCVPYNPAHTVGVQLVRKGPLELGAGGGAARAPQAAVSAAAHHRVRDRRAEGERRAARLGAGARRGLCTRCVRGGVHFQRTTLTYSPQSQPAGLRMELGQRLGGLNPSRGVYQRRVRSECGPNAATQAMCGPSASISGEGMVGMRETVTGCK